MDEIKKAYCNPKQIQQITSEIQLRYGQPHRTTLAAITAKVADKVPPILREVVEKLVYKILEIVDKYFNLSHSNPFKKEREKSLAIIEMSQEFYNIAKEKKSVGPETQKLLEQRGEKTSKDYSPEIIMH